ncbi:hypothetical protein ONS96_008618 [Cadophora gregata f. sp. sojae]|nr:hypothetical protein ONS96_008618 [Cadophora gregata f. sp. sojae]
MPEYIVAVKKGLSEEEYTKAQTHAKEKGGRIVTAYERNGVMPGFVVDIPADSINTLQSGPHVQSVEPNGEMRIQ